MQTPNPALKEDGHSSKRHSYENQLSWFYFFFFSIAAEGRDDRVRHCVISGAHKYKKQI